MRIVILMEDTCKDPQFSFEHGLSIYVETEEHKLLLDTGSTGVFAGNAKAMGIDLGEVDTLVLSHGHYDHAGGILAFAELNHKAQIYMQKSAIGEFYHGDRYTGIDRRIARLPRVELLEGDAKIDGELFLFSGVTGRRSWPQGNLELKERCGGVDVQDGFGHEQCLVVTQGEERALFSGCAHNGILNILDRYRELFGVMPRMVVSGFHMAKKGSYSEEEVAVIRRTAQELSALDTVFYTGHCTGEAAYGLMKPVMGGKLRQMHSGMEIQAHGGVTP